jgi:hypothetical protein
MRYLFYMSLIVLSLMIVSCGSGGSGLDSSSPNKTTVMINLGQRSINTGALSTQAIPPEISYIVIRISAPDMSTIERTISVNGISTIEVEVPNGLNRHIEIFAYDDSDTLLCYGDTYADFDGTPVTISINMVCVADDTPPIFSGLETAQAISETSIALSWTAATDDVTPSSAILYLIYMSMASGGQDFSAPSFTTAAGATTHTVTGLSSSTTYCFVVRAKDEAGNIDSNTVEKCATTSSSPTQEYTLTVTTSGSGSGTVTSSPSGINCGGDCSEKYNGGTVVTLTATPGEGSTFTAWSGDCGGGDINQVNTVVETENTVNITINANKTCIAIFESQQQYTLTVELAGKGSGTVTSEPSGIDCPGGDCSATYNEGTMVTLTATPDECSYLDIWSGGGCGGTGQCAVTMNADKTVTATFSYCE